MSRTPIKGVNEVNKRGLKNSKFISLFTLMSLDWFEQSTLRLSSYNRTI